MMESPTEGVSRGAVFKIDDETESPREGGGGVFKVYLRYVMKFKIYDELEWGRVQDTRCAGIAKGGGVFKIHHEPESPNEGPCLRYMMTPNREMRGRV